MKRQLTIGGLAAVLGISLLMLNGCSDSPHKPLKRLYYGYYNNKSNNQFVIIAFNPNHPRRVAVRNNVGHFKINSVFHVKYTKDSVIIKTKQSPVKLKISDDTYTLTCDNCEKDNIPKNYKVGSHNGKMFDLKTSVIAYNSIKKDAKQNGGYQY